MTNENVKLTFYDNLLAKTLLRLVPPGITPNHFTILRLLLTPGVVYFVWAENWPISIPYFLLTALTDVIDGTLARTRKQITIWGTIADPVADKILIGSVVIIFVAREINLLFALMIVSVELCVVLAAIVRKKRKGTYISANWAGKIKMLLQVAGVTLLLLAKGLGQDLFVPFSIGTFSVAIAFALISIYTYST